MINSTFQSPNSNNATRAGKYVGGRFSIDPLCIDTGSKPLLRWRSGINQNIVAGKITSWIDEIAGLNAVAGTTITTQPNLISDGEILKNVTIFDGVSLQRLSTDNFNLGNSHTICIVFKNNSNQIAQRGMFTGTDVSQFVGYNVSNVLNYKANNKNTQFDTGLRNLDYKSLVIARPTKGRIKCWENGLRSPAIANSDSDFVLSDNFIWKGIGNFTGFLPYMTIKEIIVYPSDLNEAEAMNWFEYARAAYNITPKSYFPKTVHFIGNSHSSITPGDNGMVRYARLDERMASWHSFIWADSGKLATTTLTDVPNLIVPKRDATRVKEIAYVWTDAVDLSLGTTGASLYATVVSTHNLLRAAGFKTVATTAMPQNTSSAIETERVAYNNLVIANWASFSDYLEDTTADLIIGVPGAQLNTTYFQGDKLHLTAAGATYKANIAVASIMAVP